MRSDDAPPGMGVRHALSRVYINGAIEVWLSDPKQVVEVAFLLEQRLVVCESKRCGRFTFSWRDVPGLVPVSKNVGAWPPCMRMIELAGRPAVLSRSSTRRRFSWYMSMGTCSSSSVVHTTARAQSQTTVNKLGTGSCLHNDHALPNREFTSSQGESEKGMESS